MTQYDKIGSKYDSIKNTLFNRLEQLNFRKNVQPFLLDFERTVLDLGCGTGFYSERLLEWGACSVTGVDISPVMLIGARARLNHGPFAARAVFVQGDGLEPRVYGGEAHHFDVVTGAWFLNYAKDPAELENMFTTISANLKPSGAFVSICLHHSDDVEAFQACYSPDLWAKTGVHYRYHEELPDHVGFSFKVKVSSSMGSPAATGLEFQSYHLRKSLYESAARSAGMRGKLEWRQCEFPGKEWRQAIGLHHDEAAWQHMQTNPQLGILVLWKS